MEWNAKSIEPDIMDGHMLVHPGRGDPRKKKSGSFFFALNDTSLSGWSDFPGCQGLKILLGYLTIYQREDTHIFVDL